MTDLQQALMELGLSESEVDVYLAMVEGAESAHEIGKLTRRKRPTIYYALNMLARKGLVSKTTANSRNIFRVEPPGALNGLATERLAETKLLVEHVQDMAAHLEAKPHGERPQVSFFEGEEAVKMRIMYTLYNRSKLIHSIVPKANSFWQIDPEFVKNYVEERVKKSIKTKSLWEKSPGRQILEKYYRGLSKVRLLPKDMENIFTTTIFFYDDKTLYISSKKNGYCILVQSAEHYAMMRAIFEGIWVRGVDI